MVKTTVYLPEELHIRLAAAAVASGASKAELIRRGIAMLLEFPAHPRQVGSLPVFESGHPLTAEQMDDEICHSRSAALHRARALRAADLESAYEDAWREWAPAARLAWDATAGDRLSPGSGSPCRTR